MTLAGVLVAIIFGVVIFILFSLLILAREEARSLRDHKEYAIRDRNEWSTKCAELKDLAETRRRSGEKFARRLDKIERILNGDED